MVRFEEDNGNEDEHEVMIMAVRDVKIRWEVSDMETRMGTALVDNWNPVLAAAQQSFVGVMASTSARVEDAIDSAARAAAINPWTESEVDLGFKVRRRERQRKCGEEFDMRLRELAKKRNTGV